ncbi:response regulator [Pseudomonas lalucatii]|nr:response regulator [Pseudomonas lalucatii]
MALLTVTALHDEQGAIQGFVVVAVEVPPPQPEPRAAALAVGPGAPRPAGVHARSRELSGLRLLLVEDNPTNRQVAHALLASAGAEVEVACDGEAGVAALASAQTPFDAVLMDIQLPGMDGYAACHEMRRRYASEQLPIIAMTANAMPADRAAALEAGMNEHIGKPFELATLVAVIRGLTGRGPRQAPAPVTGVAEPRPVLDSVTALRRFEGNQAIYRQALAQFIAQLAELPAALEEERARPARGCTTSRGWPRPWGPTRSRRWRARPFSCWRATARRSAGRSRARPCRAPGATRRARPACCSPRCRTRPRPGRPAPA